ncbi:MAG: aspartate 1-decarboxylase [Phycisphaerae bacterium]|nr:aspartate 1-decarboxylase [Phycisphaerae bacterium]
MQRFMLKSKIHRATLTGCELNYEGSISLDEDLLRKADMLPGEQVHVLNVNSGARLTTYIITAPAGSGTVMLNGPAARMGVPGDLLIILTYCQVDDKDARQHKPIIVHVDAHNRPVAK